MCNRKVYSLLIFAVITTLVSTLYIPFLGNGLVFDDHGIFTSLVVYDIAQTAFDFYSRTFPYFTLGFIHVVSNGSIEANRLLSICLHLACSVTLFFLLRSLLAHATKIAASSKEFCSIQILAASAAILFVIHPIAVYGVAYLAQRTILFATLFSLATLFFYGRAFSEKRTSDVLAAALFYSMAVFSKQHAIMLPLAALPLTILYEPDFKWARIRISLFLVLCLPAGLCVLLATKYIVANSYEPDVGAMLAQMQAGVVSGNRIAILDHPLGSWLFSALMQAGFFFDYIFYWIVPDVRVLSADMRFDFVEIWFSLATYVKAILFFMLPIIAMYFIRRKGAIALFCCGFLYCWFLFLTELAAVRFQEPFVLYRSYLWAPGYLMMLVALGTNLSGRWLLLIVVPLSAIYMLLAHDRLKSFVDDGVLWKDAAEKLASPTVVGSDRIFYNRGNAFLAEKRYADAIADYSSAIKQNPKFPHSYYNRGLAYLRLNKEAEALADIDHSLSLQKYDAAMYTRGFILERRGCLDAAKIEYAKSMALGNRLAKLKFDHLATNSDMGRKKSKSESDTCPD